MWYIEKWHEGVSHFQKRLYHRRKAWSDKETHACLTFVTSLLISPFSSSTRHYSWMNYRLHVTTVDTKGLCLKKSHASKLHRIVITLFSSWIYKRKRLGRSTSLLKSFVKEKFSIFDQVWSSGTGQVAQGRVNATYSFCSEGSRAQEGHNSHTAGEEVEWYVPYFWFQTSERQKEKHRTEGRQKEKHKKVRYYSERMGK